MRPLKRNGWNNGCFLPIPPGFASAMMGADYGVFANGRWYLRKNLQE